ncbi:C1 family peptidase [Rhizobium laguerreae]|uniref:C1 family peptidase n=1 Tax=Rhizobium laguerreae TaxID=1076926 RepID=UPI0014419233|nr:C1 family peptidase [Rhizobium laguerreae]MBY3278232.1 C1 family peptidase [Rhizobium laguerreae]NKM38556.1 hypothetical protein [Rhizobium laguerreae]NNH84489.1 C1 family peptidase [Rhizobium laguerreae]
MVGEPSNHRSRRSPFGGHPIRQIEGISGSILDALEGASLDEAEQILAVASLEPGRSALGMLFQGRDQTLDQVLERLAAAIPPAVAASVQEPTMTSFHLGALKPDKQVEALNEGAATIAMAPPVALPTNVNYAKLMPPIRNQGGRGTCVAHALTAVHEFYRRRAGKPVDLSEQFLYHETKKIDGSPNVCGTWQVKAATVLSKLGECEEQVWPYNPLGPCNNNGQEPKAARTNAAKYKLGTIVLPPTDVTRIKAALAGGSVVGFSIPVYDSWFKSPYTTQTGRINMRIGNEPSVGGHAMCLIGYQDDNNSPGGGFFILRNSWDISWGFKCPYGAGNGTIPYQYISRDCWEAVTSTASIKKQASVAAQKSSTGERKRASSSRSG